MRSEKERGIGVLKVEDVWTEENGMVKWWNGRNVVQEEGKIWRDEEEKMKVERAVLLKLLVYCVINSFTGALKFN